MGKRRPTKKKSKATVPKAQATGKASVKPAIAPKKSSCAPVRPPPVVHDEEEVLDETMQEASGFHYFEDPSVCADINRTLAEADQQGVTFFDILQSARDCTDPNASRIVNYLAKQPKIRLQRNMEDIIRRFELRCCNPESEQFTDEWDLPSNTIIPAATSTVVSTEEESNGVDQTASQWELHFSRPDFTTKLLHNKPLVTLNVNEWDSDDEPDGERIDEAEDEDDEITEGNAGKNPGNIASNSGRNGRIFLANSSHASSSSIACPPVRNLLHYDAIDEEDEEDGEEYSENSHATGKTNNASVQARSHISIETSRLFISGAGGKDLTQSMKNVFNTKSTTDITVEQLDDDVNDDEAEPILDETLLSELTPRAASLLQDPIISKPPPQTHARDVLRYYTTVFSKMECHDPILCDRSAYGLPCTSCQAIHLAARKMTSWNIEQKAKLVVERIAVGLSNNNNSGNDDADIDDADDADDADEAGERSAVSFGRRGLSTPPEPRR